MSLIVPSFTWIPPKNTFTRDIAFLWSGANGSSPIVGLPLISGGTPTFAASGAGRSIKLTNAATNYMYRNSHAPVVTSDRVGTGAFTVMVVANPVTVALRTMFSQRLNSGSFNQFNLNSNCDSAGGSSSGGFALITYSTAVTGVAIAGAIDGNWHVFSGRRLDTTLSLFIDGSELASASGTLRNVYDPACAVGIGVAPPTFNNNTIVDIAFAAAWNRALSNLELFEISTNLDVLNWQPHDRSTVYYRAPAAAGVTFSAAWASQSNIIIQPGVGHA